MSTSEQYDSAMGQYKVASARLQRAVAHGEHLVQLWNAVPTGRLCTPRFVAGPNGHGVLIADNVGEVPDELALLLGEMLYQLRSALDSCIYQGTVYATNQAPPPDEDRLEFPITENPNEWPKLAKRRLFGLPIPIQEAIESVQPYNNQTLPPEELVKTVSRSLGILHNLARKDRHRRLHLVGSWPIHTKPEFVLSEGVAVDQLEVMPPTVLRNGTVIARFRITGLRPDSVVYVNPGLRTNFGCNEPPAACTPSDTFDQRLLYMIDSVAGIIDYFEKNL